MRTCRACGWSLEGYSLSQKVCNDCWLNGLLAIYRGQIGFRELSRQLSISNSVVVEKYHALFRDESYKRMRMRKNLLRKRNKQE